MVSTGLKISSCKSTLPKARTLQSPRSSVCQRCKTEIWKISSIRSINLCAQCRSDAANEHFNVCEETAEEDTFEAELECQRRLTQLFSRLLRFNTVRNQNVHFSFVPEMKWQMFAASNRIEMTKFLSRQPFIPCRQFVLAQKAISEARHDEVIKAIHSASCNRKKVDWMAAIRQLCQIYESRQ